MTTQDPNFLLTCEEEQKIARSIAYAKALAPQMFILMGTRYMFKTIVVTNQQTGEIVGLYNRHGWRDAHEEQPLLMECVGCGAIKAPAGEVFCSKECEAATTQADGFKATKPVEEPKVVDLMACLKKSLDSLTKKAAA